MALKASEEVKTRIVQQKQKNGDIYVIERKTKYDPVKKFNVVLSSKILGKIPKGEEEMVPTRPKRPNGTKVLNSKEQQSEITASRRKVGMMDIIDHIGKISGIDDAIYANTDKGTAQKVISLARYLLATDGQSLPGITSWQYSHPLPYDEGLSESIYHDLFTDVGRNESLMQSFFASRIEKAGDTALLAYDSTTISTYSKQISEARFGFNKAHDGLPTVKLLSLYSVETRQPVVFTRQPGNQPDVITIENALKQLQVLGIKKAEIVTDNGYYSEKNLAEMLHAHFDFITLVKIGISWVKKELENRFNEFSSTGSACPFDTSTHGVSVMLKHEFTRQRKYASVKKGLAGGTQESFERRIYLHLYFNPFRKVEQDSTFDKDMFELKYLVEKETAEEELSPGAVEKINKYLNINRRGNAVNVTFNEKAIAEAKKYHGYFALVSNCEKDPFECLSKYRRRETIEQFFEAGKQKTDGTRTRVWSSESLMGRMFVQFVALCYYEYLSEQLRQIKLKLEEDITAEKDLAEIRKNKKKLLSWMNNTPVYLTLQWFDAVEEIKVSAKLRSRRWSTEITERDRLLINYLGMKF
ncbi:MAG: transposase [Lachnospiraceae bacterium]|jgi:transposase|uniref:IS1634 family transposase n=1 Tax=Ruminobacter amylophilus TaxID=867 RepID=UPI003870CB3C|nr:transposase [Lachnospiraceae bacterium]